MKVHWLIPLTCDAAFQFTSRNELARAFRALGNEITTTVAYANERTKMDGFSTVEYVHSPRGSLLKKVGFHWRMLQSSWRTNADVVMFGSQTAHLIPLAWVMRKSRFRRKFVVDIRTIPVDVPPGFQGWIQIWRHNLSLWLANLFCDGLTVLTPMVRNLILPRLKQLKGKIGVWTSGVNLSHFERQGENCRKEMGLEGKKILIYHGVLSPNRGLQNVVRALDILRNELPDLVFLLVGDGPGRSELEELVRNLKLTEHVRFFGK